MVWAIAEGGVRDKNYWVILVLTFGLLGIAWAVGDTAARLDALTKRVEILENVRP